MKIFSSKKRVAAIGVVTAATLVGGGVAFAYWTNGGTGTGEVATGTTTDTLTITASGPTGMVPGGTPKELVLTVSNPNLNAPVQLTERLLSLDSGTIKCGATTVDDDWFILTADEITSVTPVPAGGSAVLNPSGVFLQMVNDDENQDVCKAKTVTFDLAVN